ncbi:nitrate- and nitrite sensing domain-containing protein [Spirillospora sp. NPDC029432]|uniref:nitrate- and nitrite sensing domain-containing protein n=1 Tax=Spirillospora sp. NPDC029432 TaxID=3154599 RepID=UPI003454E815
MAGRTRSVKSRIVVLLVLPVTALVALWAFAAAQSLQDSLRQTRARTFTEKVLRPTDQMIAALQDERRMSLSFLGDDATIGRAGFDAQRAETDRTRDLFRRSAADGDIAGATRPATRERMARLASALGGLDELRRSVDGRALDRAQALGRYTEYIELAAEIYDEVHSLDPELVRANRILRTLERARENLSREDALVTGALAAGRLGDQEHLQLVQFAGAHRFLYDDASRGLPPAERAAYERIVSGPEFTRFKDLEDRLMRGGATDRRPAVDIGAWHTSTESADAQLAGFSNAIRSATTARARDEASSVLLRLGLMGGLGLVAVVVAIVVAVRAGRRLIVESRDMAAAVSEFAHHRLPEISERARRGEPVPQEAPRAAGAFRVTEIAQIDRAFGEARREVVRAAEGEAAAHKRLNEVFVTLARRNQSLLQRLLRMLEAMQRGTEDPDELERLFELDSLATRMRRHAEGLVILSGRPSGRSWRNPVRLVDVARAAAAEVEDYARVEVVPMGRTALSGPAVADTIHLMAELIENAATFSPPSTPIRVTGQQVAHGFALEVEDRGLGIDPETMEELNRLLATDPELDLDDSARLGLFVVARLAARHGIKVTLRGSPYGGVIAIALVPPDLVVEPGEIDPAAGRRKPAPIAAGPSGAVPALAAPVPTEPGSEVPGRPSEATGPIASIGPTGFAGPTGPGTAPWGDAPGRSVSGEYTSPSTPAAPAPPGGTSEAANAGPGEYGTSGGSGEYAGTGGSGEHGTSGGSGGYASFGGTGEYATPGGTGERASSGGWGDYASSGGSGEYAGSGGSGEYTTSGRSGEYGGSGGPGEGASSGGWGEYAAPGGPGEQAGSGGSGEYGTSGGSGEGAGSGGWGDYAAPGGSGEYAAPGRSGEYGGRGGYASSYGPGEGAAAGGSGEYAASGGSGEGSASGGAGEYSSSSRGGEGSGRGAGGVEHPPTLTTGELPLPRRRRQASLAPQLRRAAPPEPPAAEDDDEPAVRSPEAARDLMATMQRGWRRGRDEAEPGGGGERGPEHPGGGGE